MNQTSSLTAEGDHLLALTEALARSILQLGMTALLNTLSVLIIVVPILLAVAFMTLVERKLLGA